MPKIRVLGGSTSSEVDSRQHFRQLMAESPILRRKPWPTSVCF